MRDPRAGDGAAAHHSKPNEADRGLPKLRSWFVSGYDARLALATAVLLFDIVKHSNRRGSCFRLYFSRAKSAACRRAEAPLL
jgi:hypothetical protein